jgi:hypothetical protein
VNQIEHALSTWFHHPDVQANLAAPNTQAVPATQEGHMSAILADAGKAAQALVRHVATLASNPLVDTIVESGLGLVLTPGEITAVVTFIREIEAERKALAAPVAAAVSDVQTVAAAFAPPVPPVGGITVQTVTAPQGI